MRFGMKESKATGWAKSEVLESMGEYVGQPDQVHKTQKWTRMVLDETLQSGAEMKVLSSSDERLRLPGIAQFYREMFSRLYDKDRPLENVPREAAWAKKLHDSVSQVQEWSAMKSSCEDDAVLSLLSAGHFCSELLHKVPEMSKEQKNPQREKLRKQIEEAQQKLFESNCPTHHRVYTDQMKEAQAQLDALDASYEDLAEAMSEGALRKAARDAAEKTMEDAETLAGLDRAFAELNFNDRDRLDYLALLKRHPSLKKVLEVVGRVRKTIAKKRTSESDSLQSEISGIECGDSLQRLLPSELLNLVNEETEDVFWLRFMSKSLLQWTLKERETQGKGPMIICLDASGSMRVDTSSGVKRFDEARGLAIGMAFEAVSQGREAMIIWFSSNVRMIHHLRSKADFSLDRLETMMELEESGGTDWMKALERAAEFISGSAQRSASGLRKSDVVLVTDGVCHTSNFERASWKSLREELRFSCYGMAMLDDGLAPERMDELKAVCDEVWSGSSLMDEGSLRFAMNALEERGDD